MTVVAARASADELGGGARLIDTWILLVVVLMGAAALHWGLRRIGRRVPRWLARRSGKPIPPGAPLPWEGALQFILLVPKTGIWLAVAAFVSAQIPALGDARHMFMHVVNMSLTSPLFTLNARGYSALDVLELPAVLALLWIAVSAITRVLKTHVLGSTRMERGIQETVALLTRYTLTFLGAIVVLQIWGIDASSLTFLASILGVGIGFGLQHLANNFVSGLVVSVERPIQLGDFVKVGEWMGTVEHVGPRQTEIRTLDNISILVPNSRFLETEVVNWTHGDPVSRLNLPIDVAYGSDTARVRAALLEAARSHPDVLRDPRPRVEFRSFGDSGLRFELHVWTLDPRNQFRLISDLNFRIEANLRRHKIQVPFPQRDIHLRSPQLEHLLSAWSRRQFTEAELAPSNGHAATPALPDMPDASALEDDLGPRSWSDTQISAVAARLRGPDGLTIADRRHLLTVYRQCFVGRDAVDWMTRALGLARKEAVELGQLLMDRGFIHHVLDEHGFHDGSFFYRFTEDQRAQAS